MDSKKHTPMRAKTMAELLPGIKSILSKETMLLLSSQKKPNAAMQQTQPVKNVKPMTVAEILALTRPNSKKFKHQPSATKANTWNSSVKVDKTKLLTKDSQQKFNTVRKTLNFQQKPTANTRTTTVGPTARKSIYPQVKAKENNVNRISGINKIPETPLSIKQPSRVAKTKINNISFKSNDDSFLQKEKEINDFEAKSNALIEEPTLERIEEISPPISTPFQVYRNVRDYFEFSDADNSIARNNNPEISYQKYSEISFQKHSETQNNIREESVIVSLCEKLNKATVINNNHDSQNIGDLYKFKEQMENDLKVIDNVIVMLTGFKEKKVKSLECIRKLISDKQQSDGEKCNGTILDDDTKKIELAEPIKKQTMTVKEEITSPERNTLINRPTVIKSRSPTYKIPRKSICLRKNVFHKSMPNVSDITVTPNKNTDKAINMYMQIKSQMTFLNTPLAKPRNDTSDTPALTSRNLQSQLDKLYNDI